MDVDVEPLESQAYRRSREAASNPSQAPTTDEPSTPPPTSPPIKDETEHHNTTGTATKTPLRRRKSSRVSKPSTRPLANQPDSVRHRSSAAAGDAMDYSSTFHMGGPQQGSPSGSHQMSPAASNPAPALPVKYTPVTGRISRAKKGIPVHTCEICRPVKVSGDHESLPNIKLTDNADIHKGGASEVRQVMIFASTHMLTRIWQTASAQSPETGISVHIPRL